MQEVADPVANAPRATPRRIPEDLIRTAERLLATNGIGAPLRQIAAQAGYRNPATVQYHFGSRAGLLTAILEYRLPGLDRRRFQILEQLQAQGRDFDLRGLVEAMVRPFLELDRDSHYVELLVRLGSLNETRDAYVKMVKYLKGAELVQQRIYEQLESLPPAVRRNRMLMSIDLMLSAIAARTVRLQRGTPDGLALNDELFAQDLFDALVGLLQAEHTELRAHTE